MKITAFLAVAVLFGVEYSAHAGDRPVVVELFTSQGCSACPPAEAFLIDLVRQRPDVLALAFHVDYWDRLGWKDAFSSAAATQRQRNYAGHIGAGVYTPQMVVDGRHNAIGSNRNAVLSAIDAAGQASQDSVPVQLRRKGGKVAIEIGAGTGRGTAWMIGFDPERETAVPRGENAGRTIRQANVVRSIAAVAEWRGDEVSLTHAVPVGEKAALILQSADGGIVGAALLGG